MASPSSSRPSPPPLSSPLFTPIPEHGKEEEDDDEEEREPQEETTKTKPYKHHPTPLHHSSRPTKSTAPKKPPRSNDNDDDDDLSVSCTKCRPSSRDKISVVPLDINGLKHPSLLSPNPNGILRSLFLSITRKSPRSTTSSSSSAAPSREEEWKLAAAELSKKLLHATRRRDEALLESSRLKYSMSELESKVDRLESYCHDLRTALDRSSTTAHPGPTGSIAVEPFLRAVSDARTAVRQLSRCLTVQIRQGTGSKVLDRVASLLQPYDVKVGQCKNPKSLLFYMEALLNRVFYGEFERFGEEENRILDPSARCEANRVAYEAVRELGWEEVLSRGTRHYSEGLSRFCDRKMSEVVGMLGWARAWPEKLLQAFFGAAKGVWLVHLLARSVHPAVPVLRVEKGVGFDAGFMEDVAGDRVRRLTPVSVRMMVAPGFYVYSSSCGVVKCKVLCMYNNSETSNNSNNNS